MATEAGKDKPCAPLGTGHLTALFIAHCGLCTDPYGYGEEPLQIDMATTRAKAREMLLFTYGWHYTRKHGWVCNECWPAYSQQHSHRTETDP